MHPAIAATSALLVAAGQGTRLGSALPKAFVPLAGRPMLDWSIDALRSAGITDVVIALPPPASLPAGFTIATADASAHERAAATYVLPEGTIGVHGGVERSHSVRAALGASSGDPVLVHDAARPMLTAPLVLEALGALAADPELAAAIVAAPVTDTIKRSADGIHAAETLVRAELWAVQTPQVFRRSWLERALGQSDEVLASATDDASLVESLGGRVGLVPSGPDNLKVTTQHDIRVAELLLAERQPSGTAAAAR